MNSIPVLYFHSVAPFKHPDWYKSYLTIEIKYFEAVLWMLRTQNYRFLLLDEYFELKQNPPRSKEKFICLTFDDGYLDNYIYVYPLLKKYQAKGTVFVSPLLVQAETITRPTMESFAKDSHNTNEIQFLGYCNWAELRIMDSSGVLDVQSHTMSHLKVIAGTRLIDFHHPKSNWFYPIANLYPERAPYYAGDKHFKELLPYGYPFFEERSALISLITRINPEFYRDVVERLHGYNWRNYVFRDCMQRVEDILNRYVSNNNLVSDVESQHQYDERVCWEISESKKILETQLNKKVNHICWPHGDYSEQCHEIALQAGYLSSAVVLREGQHKAADRFDRMGVSSLGSSVFFTLCKVHFRNESYCGHFPFDLIGKVYRRLLHGREK